MSRRLMSSVLIAALVALIGGAPVGYAADPIPIGVSVAQTGKVALAGQEQVLGAQIAEDFFNKKGGVNGRRSSWSSRTPAATRPPPSMPTRT